MRSEAKRVRHPCADPDRHDVPYEYWYPGCHRAHWPGAGVDSHLGCQWIQLVYRIIAAALGLLWIGNFVPDEWRVLVFIAVGAAFFAMQFLRPAREWQWLALAYAVIGYLALAGQFIDRDAFWLSLVAIVALFGVQQLARRCEVDKKVPDRIHQWLILVGGALLFIWLSIRVSDLDGDGLLTIAWTILAWATSGLALD